MDLEKEKIIKASEILNKMANGVNPINGANSVIDLNVSRKITGVEINKQLKKMGILAEELLADGKKRTIVNDNSPKYGIVTEKRNYSGNEYDMVCFNDIGKKFLLDDLEKILEWNADI
jgi:hypothetical protein